MLNLSTGQALRAARRLYGLTQVQLADLITSHQSLIGQLEARQHISQGYQDRLHAAFGMLKPLHTVSNLDTAYETLLEALKEFHQTALKQIAAAQSSRPADVGIAATGGSGVEAPATDIEALLARAVQEPDDELKESKAAKRLHDQQEYKRLKQVAARNGQRAEDRPQIWALHEALKPLAQAQNWPEYSKMIAHAARRAAERQTYLEAYCMAAGGAVIADDDPMVTLPLENE